MNYFNFSVDEIREQVLQCMRENDCQPLKAKDENLIIDGKRHRYAVHGDKGSETSGSYQIYPDGWAAGWFQNWREGDPIKWKFQKDKLTPEQNTYFNSAEYKKHLDEEFEKQKKRDEEEKRQHEKAAELARTMFEQFPEATEHPYLKKKKVQAHGIHYNESTKQLAIPLRDIDGHFRSLQWIDEDGGKKFFNGASVGGAFFNFDLDKVSATNKIILLCEGFATGATLYEVFGFPTVSAMSSHSLEITAKNLKEKFPYSAIVIMADNDLEKAEKRGFNTGLKAAQEIKEQGYAIEFIAPPFKMKGLGTDWNDYINRYGSDNTVEKVKAYLKYQAMSEDEKNEYNHREKINSLMGDLNPTIELPPQEFIGGLFPRGFISAVVAPSGTGKTIFMQKAVSDLSLGGNFFDGFAEDEPPRKCLIFAGEAGYNLLLRRGASLKWPINPPNVKVIDQYTFESNDETVMLDEPEGWENIKRIVDMVKPDIVFFDTVMSFHSKDENKATEMKPIIKNLNDLAREKNIAIVLNHHSRKRTAKERSLSLNQDDVIGSSIFNRLVALIIGIEPYEQSKDSDVTLEKDKGSLLVRPLKTWFTTFMPFTYKIAEDNEGKTVFETDLNPKDVKNSLIVVWNYLRATFPPGEWFTMQDVNLSEITPPVSYDQRKRIFATLVKNNKLRKQGSTKGTQYSVIGFYG